MQFLNKTVSLPQLYLQQVSQFKEKYNVACTDPISDLKTRELTCELSISSLSNTTEHSSSSDPRLLLRLAPAFSVPPFMMVKNNADVAPSKASILIAK